MEQKQLGLATEKIGRLMGRYAVPCVISLLVGGFTTLSVRCLRKVAKKKARSYYDGERERSI